MLLLSVPLGVAGCASSTTTTTTTTTTTATTSTTDAPATSVTVGESSAPASTTAADTVAASSASSAPIQLRADGVADVSFGDDAEPVIARLIELLGPPASDGGWTTQQSPCENMGSRSRAVSWNTFTAIFATGPTDLVPKATDHLSAYVLLGGDTGGIGPDPSRFVLTDGKPVLGRTLAELQSWNPLAERLDSEIEGPIWTAATGSDVLSGSVSSEGADGVERTSSASAGLRCID